LFDWSAKPFRRPDEAQACRELQPRLAKVIRRLALTTNEIAALPARGVFSVLSYTGFLSPSPSERPANLAPVELARQATATVYWKQRRYDWGLLQGLWLQE
jgi:hypothetical protein